VVAGATTTKKTIRLTGHMAYTQAQQEYDKNRDVFHFNSK